MKFMKSINSEGSKCARRFAVSGGMKGAMIDPVVARIRAKANRV